MRLDHLLSKEHHETHAPPTCVGVRCAERFVGWAVPVVGVGSGAQQAFPFGRVGRRWLPNTLLGFETTSPCSFLGGAQACVSGGLVVALLWWWGVVFDLWIVVASI